MKTIIKYQFSIICALIFCLIVSLAGCYSMHPETIDAKDISHQKEYEIYSLTLKDRSRIVKDQLNYLNFIKGIPDSTGRFIHSLYSTNSKVRVITDTVPLHKVSKVVIEKSELDLAATIIVPAVSVLVVVGVILLIYSLSGGIMGDMHMSWDISGKHKAK